MHSLLPTVSWPNAQTPGLIKGASAGFVFATISEAGATNMSPTVTSFCFRLLFWNFVIYVTHFNIMITVFDLSDTKT